METWKALSCQLVMALSPCLRVKTHMTQLPNRQVIDGWPWLIWPDFVNITFITQDERYLCFHQTKHSVDGTTLAPVGGYI